MLSFEEYLRKVETDSDNYLDMDLHREVNQVARRLATAMRSEDVGPFLRALVTAYKERKPHERLVLYYHALNTLTSQDGVPNRFPALEALFEIGYMLGPAARSKAVFDRFTGPCGEYEEILKSPFTDEKEVVAKTKILFKRILDAIAEFRSQGGSWRN